MTKMDKGIERERQKEREERRERKVRERQKMRRIESLVLRCERKMK